jgi:predicted nucleotidyltransferase component of viral defense system
VHKDWRKNHAEVIDSFLKTLNSKTSEYILKGGTALMECYGLDRFSEDIDLDGLNAGKIKSVVEGFCRDNSFSARIAKDTPTVLRFMINYEGIDSPTKPLKIEISFRTRQINPDFHTKINDIEVYKINNLAASKASAYTGRDKLRDLYDICFICKNYWDELTPETHEIIRNAVFQKGIEQYDYIIQTQSDPLIDNDKLATDFLRMYEILDIPLENDTPKQEISDVEEYDYELDDDDFEI